MNAVTQAEFARILGVERSYVTALKKAGRLVLNAIGNVLVDESQARIAETADPGKAGVADMHAKKRGEPNATVDGKKQPKTENEEDPENDLGQTPDYQKARARREEANANLAELELARLAGDLMETAAVRIVLADAAATCRAALETLPTILAPQLAAIGDDHAIRQLLEEHIGSALNELCDRLAGLGKEGA